MAREKRRGIEGGNGKPSSLGNVALVYDMYYEMTFVLLFATM